MVAHFVNSFNDKVEVLVSHEKIGTNILEESLCDLSEFVQDLTLKTGIIRQNWEGDF